MKFIFFYSQLYEYYYSHIYKNISSVFDLEAIKIDNLNNYSTHTFWGGVSIKIELVIQKIKENLGQSIIFTDATIFINSNNVDKLFNFFNLYIDNDLCFVDENHYNNIGIILIKCNEKTLTFFENILHELIDKKGWDQQVINEHLKNNSNLKINRFDKEKICCGWDFNPMYKDTFLIYKSFIHHDTNIINNFNMRLDIFKNAGLISEEEYNVNKQYI
jgi:hypothetical protein